MYGQQPPSNFEFDDNPSPPPYPQQPAQQPQAWGTGQSTDRFGNPVSPYGYQPMPPPPPPKNRSLSCLIIFIIAFAVCLPLAITAVVLVAVGGGVTASLGGLEGIGDIGNMISTAASVAGGPEMQAIQGDPSNFDPLVSLDQAQAFAGDGARIAAITAAGVRSDGTMDLNADYTPAPYTDYEFVILIDPPENAPPVGAGGNSGGQWYQPITISAFEPGQMRRFTQIGGDMNITSQYVNEGMTREVGEPTTNPFDLPIPAPRCLFTDLWDEAIQQGAPEDGIATIDYDEDGYTFNMVGVMVLRFDMDCSVG